MDARKPHIVEMRGDVTDARRRTNNEQLKIELLSQWKLEAESRNNDGIRFQHLEFGLKIFSVLHYCPNYVEASKIAIFYEPTLEAKSLRTKIQTTTQITKLKI